MTDTRNADAPVSGMFTYPDGLLPPTSGDERVIQAIGRLGKEVAGQPGETEELLPAISLTSSPGSTTLSGREDLNGSTGKPRPYACGTLKSPEKRTSRRNGMQREVTPDHGVLVTGW